MAWVCQTLIAFSHLWFPTGGRITTSDLSVPASRRGFRSSLPEEITPRQASLVNSGMETYVSIPRGVTRPSHSCFHGHACSIVGTDDGEYFQRRDASGCGQRNFAISRAGSQVFSDVPGQILGCGFYKGLTNTGVHVAVGLRLQQSILG
jgi:hypothetical protein